jgi:hypothetical protein
MTLRQIPRTVFFIVLILCGAITSAFPQSDFEGIIESKNITLDERGKPQEFTMTMFIKQNMVRIQTSAIGSTPSSVMIYRGDKKIVWMVNDGEKSYFEIAQDQQAAQIYSPSGAVTKPTMKLTGKTKQILGFECEGIRVTTGETQTEIWATKSLGNVYKTISHVLGGEAGGLGDGWEEKVMGMGFFPLSAATKMEGKVFESQEVTKIEKKALPPSMFELPAGYKKEATTGLIDGGQ